MVEYSKTQTLKEFSEVEKVEVFLVRQWQKARADSAAASLDAAV